jgi:hypothetical protein
MKFFLLTLCLISFSSLATTPLDIKAGLWKYETDTDAIMDSMLATVPEAQREMVKQMMKSKEGAGMAAQINKPIYQCHTEQMIKDPQGVFEAQKKQNPKMANCAFKMVSSSSTKARFKLNCEQTGDMEVSVKTEGQEKQIIETTMKKGPMKSIKSTATWVGTDCSKATKLEKPQ